MDDTHPSGGVVPIPLGTTLEIDPVRFRRVGVGRPGCHPPLGVTTGECCCAVERADHAGDGCVVLIWVVGAATVTIFGWATALPLLA